MPTFNILTDAPTITYPNGGEIFVSGDIDIEWIEPINIPLTELVWYEIFITDYFDLNKKSELLQIGTIPSGNSSYSYYINKNFKGEKCRIGIRAVNHEGVRSKISFSADDFTIVNRRLPSPSLLEPIHGNTYFSNIPIIFNHSAILGRCSQRAFYQIYYSSNNQNIDWTLLRGNIIVGSDPFQLDVSNFTTDSDYSFKIELVDGENVSSPLFIDDIIINNMDYFIIDTVAPKGSIKIIDNQEYVKEKNIITKLEGYDKTTDIKEVRIEQTNISLDSAIQGQFLKMTPFVTWDIRGEDGIILIQARFKDYGDNIIQSFGDKYFRTYKSLNNQEVTAFLYDNNNLYIAFAAGDGNPQLYKNNALFFTLDGEATALISYNNTLYISIKDDENKGILQKISGGEIETVYDNESQYLNANQTTINSLYSSDSVINTMVVFDSKLFMGLQNGELLSFNGATISSEYNDYINIKSIRTLETDDILLYIYFNNSTEIVIMNKNISGDYIFNRIDTGN